MPTEHDIDCPEERSAKGCDRIGNPSGTRWQLFDGFGPIEIGRLARQDSNGCKTCFGQCPEKIAVVLRDAATTPVGIRHKRKHCGRRPHAAWISNGRLVRAVPFSTACDQRRETMPFDSVLCPIDDEASPIIELIHAPVGTLKPDFARATTSFGKGVVGAAASAA